MKNRVTSDHLYMMRRFIREHHHCDVSIRRGELRVESNGRVPVCLRGGMLAPRHFLTWLLLPSYDLKRSYVKDVERGLEPPPPPDLRIPLATCGEGSRGSHEYSVNITRCVGSGPEARLSVDLFGFRSSSQPHVDVQLLGRLHLLNVKLENTMGARNPIFDDWDAICSEATRERLRFCFWSSFWCGDGISLPVLNQILSLLAESDFTFRVEVPARVRQVLEDYGGPADDWRRRYRLFCEGRVLEDPGDPPEDPHGEAVARFLAQLPSRT